MFDEPLIVQPSTDDIATIKGYKVTKWHEHDNYECLYCQYSTLWEGKMQKHQSQGDHPWAHPGQNPAGLGSTNEEDGPEY